jgi:hypothetical protein
MKTIALATALLTLSFGTAMHAPDAQETAVTQRAVGSFDVKLSPQPVHAAAEAVLARRSIEKEFRGELAGSSRGEMLMAGTEVPGSAGYVAIERVTGTLGSRTGSFLLIHKGVMERGGGAPLDISVIPDSGTGQLAGITGRMDISIENGRHDYVFEYTLP